MSVRSCVRSGRKRRCDVDVESKRCDRGFKVGAPPVKNEFQWPLYGKSTLRDCLGYDTWQQWLSEWMKWIWFIDKSVIQGGMYLMSLATLQWRRASERERWMRVVTTAGSKRVRWICLRLLTPCWHPADNGAVRREWDGCDSCFIEGGGAGGGLIYDADENAVTSEWDKCGW